MLFELWIAKRIERVARVSIDSGFFIFLKVIALAATIPEHTIAPIIQSSIQLTHSIFYRVPTSTYEVKNSNFFFVVSLQRLCSMFITNRSFSYIAILMRKWKRDGNHCYFHSSKWRDVTWDIRKSSHLFPLPKINTFAYASTAQVKHLHEHQHKWNREIVCCITANDSHMFLATKKKKKRQHVNVTPSWYVIYFDCQFVFCHLGNFLAVSLRKEFELEENRKRECRRGAFSKI